MERSMAELLLSVCKPDELDRQYDNPCDDPLCRCQTCLEFPRAIHRGLCNCSRCIPEIGLYHPPPKSKKSGSDIPQNQRLTKAMRELGTVHLEKFRYNIWDSVAEAGHSFLPLSDYLPDIIIKQILNQFAFLDNVDAVTVIVKDIKILVPYRGQLFAEIQMLRVTFADMQKTATVETRAKAAKVRASKTAKIRATKGKAGTARKSSRVRLADSGSDVFDSMSDSSVRHIYSDLLAVLTFGTERMEKLQINNYSGSSSLSSSSTVSNRLNPSSPTSL